jgi:hypothetical protein
MLNKSIPIKSNLCKSERVCGCMEGINKIGLAFAYVAVISALIAILISVHTIMLHLYNYRRPDLQRVIIRILLMVPIYATTTLISLFFKNASDYIDTFRDIYEAFVVYSFFVLLVNYLDGERALLRRLKNRIRIHHLWPFHYFLKPLAVIASILLLDWRPSNVFVCSGKYYPICYR